MPEQTLGIPCPKRVFGCFGPRILTREDARILLGPFYIEGAALIVCGLIEHSDMTGTRRVCEETLLRTIRGGDNLELNST